MPVTSKKFLDIQAVVECRFTLKRVCYMIRKHSQMHHKDKNLQLHTTTVQIHFKTRLSPDKETQSNEPHRLVLTTQLNNSASVASWLSVRVQTK